MEAIPSAPPKRRAAHENEWSQAKIDQITALWAEGLSTPEIGHRMGITKGAVIGKAHRLNLPPRPSPILRDAERKPRRPYAESAAITARNKALAEPQRRQGGTGLLLGPTLSGVRVMYAPVVSGRPVKSCCWPFGEPRTPSFRFCGGPAVPTRPYCDVHLAQAYVPSRPREIADAA